MPGTPQPTSLAGCARRTYEKHPNSTADQLVQHLLADYPQYEQTDYKILLNACRRAVQGTTGYVKKSEQAIVQAPAPAAPAAPEPTPAELLGSDRAIRRLQGEVKDLKRRYRAAVDELDLSERRYETALNIKEPVDMVRVLPLLGEMESEATALALYSDWHLEERVDLEQLDGLNEYTPEIAEKRAFLCFQNTLKLVQKERAAVPIEEMVLWLGGDFITGYIHEELSQTNWLSPTEATRVAKRLLVGGIKFFLEHGKFRKLRIICNPGNHGRTTHKMQIANSHKMSYEWMLYNDLADIFSGDPRVEFHIPTSPFGYIQVYDKVIRTFHGESVKYGGGIGGVAIPLLKYVGRLDKQRVADLNVLGHFHQSIRPAKNIIMNGSLIGFSPYAQKIGFEPEVPQQQFLLIDKKRGFTMSAPIHCQ